MVHNNEVFGKYELYLYKHLVKFSKKGKIVFVPNIENIGNIENARVFIKS